MRNTRALWPTLKRLLAYGAPWRNSLIIAVIMLWVAAAAEVHLLLVELADLAAAVVAAAVLPGLELLEVWAVSAAAAVAAVQVHRTTQPEELED